LNFFLSALSFTPVLMWCLVSRCVSSIFSPCADAAPGVQGILRQSTINDLPVGRSVDETLRLLQAFQFHEKHGEVCPAGWTPGGESMKADESGLKTYFAKKQ